MKRVLVMFLLVLLSTSLFAQYVEDKDGHDWVSWNLQQRVAYIQGFLSAYTSIWERFAFEMGSDLTPEMNREFESWFLFEESVGYLIDHISLFYSYRENLHHRIYRVLLFVGNKDYWNERKELPRSPLPERDDMRRG